MDPRRLRASTVASYLRTALGAVASSNSVSADSSGCSKSSASTSGGTDGEQPITNDGDSGQATAATTSDCIECIDPLDNDVKHSGCSSTNNAAVVAQGTLDASAVGQRNEPSTENTAGSDASGCSDLSELHDRSFTQSQSLSSRPYCVTYEIVSEDDDAFTDATSSTAHSSAAHLQFVDVLLQADAHGLGLNIKATPNINDLHSTANNDSTTTMLVVESFRRLHAHDIGPAEASQQIKRGDVLDAVDGTTVRDLQELVDALARAANSGTPFVLLRFLRAAKPQTPNEPLLASPITQPTQSVAAPWLASASHTALLVRELADRNTQLRDALVASQLACEQQRIQLEQLYTLYNKTQLERTPSTFGPTASRLFVSKQQQTSQLLSLELERAVCAERKRLQAHYVAQLESATQALAAQHAESLQQQRDAADKKLAMLTTGFNNALEQLQQQHVATIETATIETAAIAKTDNQRRASIATCSCGRWLELQQELTLHQSLDHDVNNNDSSSNSECLVCALLTDARKHAAADAPTTDSSDTTSSSSSDDNEEQPTSTTAAAMCVAHVRSLLREYDALQCARTQQWDALQQAQTTATSDCAAQHP